MSRRSSGRRTMLLLGLLAASALALPSQAAAKPTASADIQEPTICTLTGSYSWSGVGKPHVAAEFTISNALGPVLTVNVNSSDRSGSIATAAPLTGLFLTTYIIDGFLIDRNGHHFMERTDQVTTGDCR